MNLLTGATGFVGGHVVEYLFQQNEISKATFRMGSHLKILDLNGVQGMEADLLDHHSLHEAAEGADTVYSMASPMPGEDDDFEKLNTNGISNLLEVSREMGVKTLVHLSTIDVYGFRAREVGDSTPPNPEVGYQAAKASGERILMDFSKRNASPRVVVIRAARAVGSRDDSLVVPLLKMVQNGKVVFPGSGAMSFTHPRDIAQAMYKAAVNPGVPGGLYNVKSFDATPEDLAFAIAGSLGRKVEVKKPGLFSRPALPEYTARQLQASLRYGAQESWSKLGYSPEFDLGRTAEEVAAWYRKESWVTDSA